MFTTTSWWLASTNIVRKDTNSLFELLLLAYIIPLELLALSPSKSRLERPILVAIKIKVICLFCLKGSKCWLEKTRKSKHLAGTASFNLKAHYTLHIFICILLFIVKYTLYSRLGFRKEDDDAQCRGEPECNIKLLQESMHVTRGTPSASVWNPF